MSVFKYERLYMYLCLYVLCANLVLFLACVVFIINLLCILSSSYISTSSLYLCLPMYNIFSLYTHTYLQLLPFVPTSTYCSMLPLYISPIPHILFLFLGITMNLFFLSICTYLVPTYQGFFFLFPAGRAFVTYVTSRHADLEPHNSIK